MKKNVHPFRKNLRIILSDGSSFGTTVVSRKKRWTLDIDCKTHFVWNGEENVVDGGGQLAKFRKRYNIKK